MAKIEVPSKRESVDLRSLCRNDDELYDAMTNFLLLDPVGQERHVGSIAQLTVRGAEALRNGNKNQARIDYEFAAKLALYYKDKAAALKMLELANQVSEGEESMRARHDTLLSNLDTAMSIAEQYYTSIYKKTTSEQPIEDKGVPKPVLLITK